MFFGFIVLCSHIPLFLHSSHQLTMDITDRRISIFSFGVGFGMVSPFYHGAGSDRPDQHIFSMDFRLISDGTINTIFDLIITIA